MKITIEYPPLSLSEKGRRDNNQDNIFCAVTPSEALGLFIVCDGVGGAADGENASRIVAEGFGQSFYGGEHVEDNFQETLNQVQLDIDEYLKIHPKSRGMGTTLALLRIYHGGAFVAHIGDSRVYQFRDGNVLFCTDDHSLANEMFKKGLIHDINEVKRNVITRAIQGRSDRFVQADYRWLTDIEPGDYFMVCSDGVWGCFDNEKLGSILQGSAPCAEKIDYIQKVCAEKSNDNYSAILLKVKTIDKDQENTSNFNSHPIRQSIPSLQVENLSTEHKYLAWWVLFFCTLLALLVGWWFRIAIK